MKTSLFLSLLLSSVKGMAAIPSNFYITCDSINRFVDSRLPPPLSKDEQWSILLRHADGERSENYNLTMTRVRNSRLVEQYDDLPSTLFLSGKAPLYSITFHIGTPENESFVSQFLRSQ